MCLLARPEVEVDIDRNNEFRAEEGGRDKGKGRGVGGVYQRATLLGRYWRRSPKHLQRPYISQNPRVLHCLTEVSNPRPRRRHFFSGWSNGS